MSQLVLITGSTDGIGRQIALDLAAMDYNIIIHGRDASKCKKIVNEITTKYPKSQVDYFVADLGYPNEIKRMSDEIHAKYTSLNILINNAGINGKSVFNATTIMMKHADNS